MAGRRPAAELAVGGVGAAVFGGQVLPGAGGTGDPEDGVQRAAPVGGRAPAGVVGVGEVAGEEGEFGVGEGVEGVGVHFPTLRRVISDFQGIFSFFPSPVIRCKFVSLRRQWANPARIVYNSLKSVWCPNMSSSLFAFVLMPFSNSFDDTYKLGIKAAASECGIVVERVDEQIFHNQQILDRIYNQIDVADFIIADMSERNPNVFYEVGYAHARQKPCILLTKEAGDIPFDLKHRRHIIYEGSISKLKHALVADINAISAEISRSRRQRISVSAARTEGYLDKNQYTATGRITMVFAFRNESDIRSPNIDSVYFYAKDGWKIEQNGRECPSDRSDVPEYTGRYFLEAPARALPAKGFAELKLTGHRVVWSKFSGEEPKTSHRFAGRAMIRVHTDIGNFDFPFNIDILCDEFPF